MPRIIPKGFEGAPAYRWVRMYKGNRYRVSCDELGLPPDQWNELGSYQLFNQWWAAKQQEIDGKLPAMPEEAKAVLGKLKRKLAYCQKEGLGNEAAIYAKALVEAEADIAAGHYDLVPRPD